MSGSLTFYCMECWAEVPEAAPACPSCGADLDAQDRAAFDQKLVRALRHPAPDVARRVVEIIGRRRLREAVPALLARFDTASDPYLAAEIASALGRIGGPEADAALREWSRSDSVLVRRAAAQALSSRTAAAPAGGGDDAPPDSSVREALASLAAMAERRDAREIAGLARAALEPLDRGEVAVAVVGQFKRGKTSLINAILGRAVLPTGAVPLTSVATLVRYGARPTAEVVFQDGRRRTVDVGALEAYVSEGGNPGNEKGVGHVEVSDPSPLLERGLVLVDTPGVGSAHTETTERAIAFLPRIDAAVVVLSPDPPISQTELEYVREIRRHTSHLFFVFNKIDLYDERVWRESLEYSRAQLLRSLGGAEPDLHVFPLSAAPRPHASAHGATARAPRTGLDAFVGALRTFVEAHGGEVMRNAARRRLHALARSLLGLLELESSALRGPTRELERRIAELEPRRAELRERASKSALLLEHSARRLADVARRSLLDLARKAAPSVAADLRALVRDAKGMSNGELAERVNELIERRVRELFDEWQRTEGREIASEFAELMAAGAREMEEAVADLRGWLASECGIDLPPTPQRQDLVESTGFYYLVEAARPQLTIDIVGLRLLPRPLLRSLLRRRALRMALEEMERNAGRVRGELLYRLQETARQFRWSLERYAADAGDALEMALQRALARKRTGEEQVAAALREIDAIREQVLGLLPPDGAPAECLAPAAEP